MFMKLILSIILMGILISFSYAQLSSSPLEKSDGYDVLRHQERAMNVLLGWSGASVMAGSTMLFHDSITIRDMGIQNMAWGVIDAGIALYARHSISSKMISDISVQKEKQNFRKLLLVNSLLDIVYVGIGTAMTASGKEKLKGHGYGIIIQGAFLLIFDGINFFLIPET